MKEKQQHITDRNESGLSNLTDEELWVSSAVADDTQQYDVDQAFERFRKRTGLDQSGRQDWTNPADNLISGIGRGVLQQWQLFC